MNIDASMYENQTQRKCSVWWTLDALDGVHGNLDQIIEDVCQIPYAGGKKTMQIIMAFIK